MKNSAKLIFDNIPKLKISLASLTKRDVYVGIPGTNTLREEPDGQPEDINNATIGYMMQNGIPEKNVPARPFMTIGMNASKEAVVRSFKTAAKKALHQDDTAITIGLERAGLTASAEIKKAITDGIPPPLADSTLKARARKYKYRKAERAELAARASGEQPSLSVKPLVDTGQLRNSITYVIRNKK